MLLIAVRDFQYDSKSLQKYCVNERMSTESAGSELVRADGDNHFVNSSQLEISHVLRFARRVCIDIAKHCVYR